VLNALLAVGVGCARPAEQWPPNSFILAAGPQLGYAIKRVIQRQPPVTLVGHDGSVCRTSREQFNRTEQGRWIACIWNFPILDSTQTVDSLPQTDDRTIAVLH
jgi:hypothetical protein